jgi:mannose-6-phosphate isomerase
MNLGIVPLKGTVRHYDWGGREFIPALLGISNRDRKPYAELWIGAHPSAPSLTGTGTLEELIRREPEAVLGQPVAARFAGQLPFLLKVLDVQEMLSLQAHPGKEQAAAGFARENAAGLPTASPERNYRDLSHKPEIMVALTDFWLLEGFQPIERITRTLADVAEFRPLRAHAASLRELYAALMTMPQERVDAILDPLIRRLEREEPATRDSAAHWALRAAGRYSQGGCRDRGIFFAYLMNLLHLRPGQGIFHATGVLHCYLEGANVELMANSDNVLRGGLTPKHVDTEELMRALSFAGAEPEPIEGDPVSPVETVYRTPAEEFELSRIELGVGKPPFRRMAAGPEALILLEGSAALTAGEQEFALTRGDTVLAPHGCAYAIEALAGPAHVFRACVPNL